MLSKMVTAMPLLGASLDQWRSKAARRRAGDEKGGLEAACREIGRTLQRCAGPEANGPDIDEGNGPAFIHGFWSLPRLE